jgi:hypothetical protein
MVWRNLTPSPEARPPGLPPPLSTPLVWAGGGVLLTLSLWLTGFIALVKAVIELFD